MKSFILGVVLLCCYAVQAQAPAAAPVALKDEPHHHLIFENEYVRVWAFGITGHDTTLVHNHDLPYLGIALGPADYVNGVTGKPETHAKLADGQVNYSKGGFSHLVRTETDMPFRNFTIELLKPQGTPRNRCVAVVAGQPLGECPKGNVGGANELGAPSLKPVFETDEMVVESGVIAARGSYTEVAGLPARLLLVLDQSTLTVESEGQPAKVLHTGDVLWLPAKAKATFANATALQTCAFDLVEFMDGGGKN
ncbi:MAG: hypothetical protein WB780_23645 [Candidatus Acidiferrales bacterium]